ncbi:MAG: hypothetical protein IJ115_03800 [Erysipelotrichaceae bacterium]|nr:hypothetical protein [Erysipelotrichaceae bacterium]
MKKVITLLIAMMLLLTGCKGFSYTFSGSSNNVTIEATADDGKYGESSYFTLDSDEKIVITTDLKKGELQLEFAEATVFIDTDSSSDDVTIGKVVHTVKVSGNDTEAFELPAGDYVILVTASGRTEGKVLVDLVKK